MVQEDRPAFAELLAATFEVYSNATLTPNAVAIWWAALERYPLEAVRGALSAHLTNPDRGRFAPKPADIIAALIEQDGHPRSDEAWALCPLDEAQTTIWTEQIQEAYFSGPHELLKAGDRVAARMAFRDSYARVLGAARMTGVPIRWTPSFGTDAPGREPALREAVERGRLPAAEARRLLPHGKFDEPQRLLKSRQ